MTDTSTAKGKIITKVIFVHRRALTIHNCWKRHGRCHQPPHHVHFLELKF